LNKGGDITSGLKKVDKSQMTHKNPELRQTSAVPEKKSPPEVKAKPGALARQPSQVAKKPAKTELEGGNKWSVVSLFSHWQAITWKR
jgi:adenylyl cyclase-associated protein